MSYPPDDPKSRFIAVYAEGDPGNGIFRYDLKSPADRVFAFDCSSRGSRNGLVLYRPGGGAIFVLEYTGKDQDGRLIFSPVYATGDPGIGICGYDLKSPADRVFAFDCDSSGKLDGLVLYRPGRGAIFVLQNKGKDPNGHLAFDAVYAQGDPGIGICGYDLLSPADRVFAFDIESSGKLDDLVLYRPGAGTFCMLRRIGDGQFEWWKPTPLVRGISGYDLMSPADRVFAFDEEGDGKLDDLVCYRPGAGTVWILRRMGNGQFEPRLQPVYGMGGIGCYDFLSPADRVFAFDEEGSGKLDDLVCYRPGAGKICIAQRTEECRFNPVYNEGDAGNGIGGYDLKSPADRAFAFDCEGSGKLDDLVLYRPGGGAIFILQKR